MLRGISLVCAACAVFFSVYTHATSYSTWADVVDVEPVINERVEVVPVERCREYRDSRRIRRDRYERVEDDRIHEPAPWRSIVGGLIGGLVGNQFGGGNGKKAFTIAGAIAGASIAQHRGARNTGRRDKSPVRRCEIEHERRAVEDLVGYDVTYRYHGREFTKRTKRHPGNRIRVNVEMSPVAWASR